MDVEDEVEWEHNYFECKNPEKMKSLINSAVILGWELVSVTSWCDPEGAGNWSLLAWMRRRYEGQEDD